jgi:hypothetical protein
MWVRGILKISSLVTTSFFLFHTQVADAATSCKDFSAELQLLRKAQGQIINGLADNHEKMADSLVQISRDLRFYSKPAPIKVIHNMNGMAKAYRKRGEKAKTQAQLLDDATADLIQRISLCLKK